MASVGSGASGRSACTSMHSPVAWKRPPRAPSRRVWRSMPAVARGSRRSPAGPRAVPPRPAGRGCPPPGGRARCAAAPSWRRDQGVEQGLEVAAAHGGLGVRSAGRTPDLLGRSTRRPWWGGGKGRAIPAGRPRPGAGPRSAEGPSGRPATSTRAPARGGVVAPPGEGRGAGEGPCPRGLQARASTSRASPATRGAGPSPRTPLGPETRRRAPCHPSESARGAQISEGSRSGALRGSLEQAPQVERGAWAGWRGRRTPVPARPWPGPARCSPDPGPRIGPRGERREDPPPDRLFQHVDRVCTSARSKPARKRSPATQRACSTRRVLLRVRTASPTSR